MVTESETALLADSEAGPESLADRVLLERFVINGDRLAMEAVIDRHWATAVRVARRYTGNESDAEDCVQEALLRACRAAGQYSGRGTVRAWLLQSVVNACRMRFREEDARAHRQRQVGEAEWLHRRSEGPDLEADEQRQMVRDAVADLPERYRVPLWLRYVEDLSPQEVAAALGRPEATVRSQIHRGLKQVSERLGRGGPLLAIPALIGLLGDLQASTGPTPAALTAGAIPTAAPVAAGGAVAGGTAAAIGGGLLVAGLALGIALGSLAGDDELPPSRGMGPAPPPVVVAGDARPHAPALPHAVADHALAAAGAAGSQREPGLLFDAGSDPAALRRYRARLVTEGGRRTGHASEPAAVELVALEAGGPALGIILDASIEAGTTETLIITQAFPDEPVLALDCRLRLPSPPDGDQVPLQLTALLRTVQPEPAPRRVLEVHPEVLRTSGLLAGSWVPYRAELEHCQDNGAPATELRYYLADRLYMRSRIELRSEHLLPVSVTDHRLEIDGLRVSRATARLTAF